MKNKIYLTAIASAILLITPIAVLAAGIQNPTITSPDVRSPADELVQTGLQQFRAQKFDLAIASWQQALNLYQQQKNSKGAINVLETLAEASKMLGKYEKAIAYSQQLLALAQSLGDRRTEANALGNLGNNYRIVGNYAKALEVQNQGLVIRKELNDQQGEGQVLASLGNIHYDLGNYNIAANFFQRSLEIAKAVGNGNGIIFLLNSLGAIAGTQEEYPQAIKYYQESLDDARKIGFREAEGNALNNIGSSYHVQRKYKEAIAYYSQALTVAKELTNPRMEGAAVGGMGLAYVFLEEYDKALSLQEQSWQLAKKIGDRRLEAMTLSNWGYTLWRSQKYAEAEQKFLTSLNLLESLRSNLSDGDKVSIFDTQLHAFNLLQQIMVAQGKPEEALEIAERGRARAFAELLSRRVSSSSAPKADQKNDSIIPSLASVSIADIRRIAKQQNAVMVEYSLIADPSFIGQGKLKGEFIKLYIWVVQPSGAIAFREVDLKKINLSIMDLVADIRSLFNDANGIVRDPKDVLDKYADLKQLHTILIQPIQDLLPKEANTRVIFLPQGLLFLVPFAALINPKNEFLIEKHTVQIAPAIQVLDFTHQLSQQLQKVNLQEVLIVGNPTMPSLGNPLTQLPTLLGAEKEAKAIASLMNTTFLTGDNATKVEVVNKMKSARFVHLATHGLLEEYRKGDIPGAIALAPSSTDDGFLTASEIVTMRLNAEMVVLSACKTGQGLLTGDGVIGLSRSLITAGVPSVVVSLWAVPDDPTALLMTEFYKKLQTEPNKAQAIRHAMLATKAKYPDPLNWAAFTLIGEN
ncbi:high-affnity carbon uptake protein Hat/HatR [Pseudanabaena sp. lw0831]|uniref:CHAT domain-containing protein n=1 Tax=Pseudanabaena sp. lw0831 TaxID=1357935 RepID=UPI001915502A|nr:CHAT domain-containing tetratricopeptide repeat protein [Pseudanabaena sp. lw0831]GBO54467.1 high-affnity carbon uptake protein Hat/HatR [Pseudanabaena sp. lw0831]